ncbi:hypothetical protein HUJ04_003776 [Dendroctonus ponderosae]|nr:hypothetical protein HUJ04_003776 [Dendroctonus ponderosae]
MLPTNVMSFMKKRMRIMVTVFGQLEDFQSENKALIKFSYCFIMMLFESGLLLIVKDLIRVLSFSMVVDKIWEESGDACWLPSQMVTAEPGTSNATAENPEGGTTFGKLKQTLSSSLLTAQDRVVTKMGPRPSLVPDQAPNDQQSPPSEDKPAAQITQATACQKSEPGKPPSRAGACRVCLKAFKPDDFSRTCATCTQRVCEDCASYSKLAENEDPTNWTCSVCRSLGHQDDLRNRIIASSGIFERVRENFHRRAESEEWILAAVKMQSRAAVITQDSNESLLEIPLQELQRRHSEARLGSSGGALTVGSVGSGLAPPRSPELRRHSDVSPASLKELEKTQLEIGTY